MDQPGLTDKQVIENMGSWPRWPFMPMKKRNKDSGFPWDLGLIVAGENQLSTVFLGLTIWDRDLGDKLKTWECKRVYPTIDAMFADGWICD